MAHFDTNKLFVSKLPQSVALQCYLFLTLLVTLPALRANSLLPLDFFDHLAHEYPPSFIVNPIGIFAFLPLAFTWILAKQHRGQHFLLPVLAYATLMLATLSRGEFAYVFADFYGLLAIVSLAIYAIYGSTFSLSTYACVALLFFWRQQDPTLSQWSIALFVLALLVLRFGVIVWRQNRDLLQAMGRQNIKLMIRRTLTLWWPMLILLAIGVWLSEELSSRSEDALYSAQLIVPLCVFNPETTQESKTLVCPPGHQTLSNTQFSQLTAELINPDLNCQYAEDLPLNVDPSRYRRTFGCPDATSATWEVSRLPLFDNIDLTVKHHFAMQHVLLDQKLLNVDEEVDTSEAIARQEARELFKVVPPDTGMSRRRCKFPYVACQAGNLVIDELNKAYSDARSDAEYQFVEEMGNRVGAGADMTKTWAEDARSRLEDTLNEYEDKTRTAIARVHSASNVLQQLIYLWLCVVVIKSLLYVFSRVVFDETTNIKVNLTDHQAERVEGEVSKVEEIDIATDYPHDVYYRANYQPLGPAPRFSIPQWRSSALARIRAGAWNMSLVNMPMRDGNQLTFSAIEAEHLVEWDMQEGEEVVFRYGSFVAMNSNVKLKTVISLRAASLLLGRVIFHTAYCDGGPGKLVLRTRGKPATAEQVEQSIPLARLVAWSRHTQFSVDSHLTPADVFLNGFNLRRAADDEGSSRGILIVEADARDGGVLVGTLRFARNFLLPI